MRRLARLTVRGRRGQAVALAATVLFSTVLIGAFALLLETGVRGQVATGEYARAPVLFGPPQSVPVADDVDMAVPGRALLPASFAERITAAMPSSRVVVDRIVPATLAAAGSPAVPVEAHPWSAFALGRRTLSAGRGPATGAEVALPAGVARSRGLRLGRPVELGFGDAAQGYRLVGLTSASDGGTDVPDVYLADAEARRCGHGDDRVAAVGVWPGHGDDPQSLDRVARQSGVRRWPPGDRGELEVVAQGRAKAALVSVAGAAGALAFVVAVFTVVTLTALQVRERSRELAMLRVVGATPRQVKRLLRGEIRSVSLAAGAAGAVLGPFAGAALVRAIRSWGVLPRGVGAVFGPLPFVGPVLVALAATEIAARIALRRVVRGSPLLLLDGGDDTPVGSPRASLRISVGVLVLLGGLVMAAAPWYASGDAASGLPALSGLVIALAVALLAALVVRGAARLLSRLARRSASGYLALNAVAHRAARVGSALAPIVLGVTLACVQLFSTTTAAAVAADQVRGGYRADLMVTSSATGVGRATAELVRHTAGVRSAIPLASGSVVARVAGHDTRQTLDALGADGDEITRYADLDPSGRDDMRLGPGDVALGVQGAADIGADVHDRLELVLPDGRAVTRRVAFVYRRGLGFGELLAPRADLLAGRPRGQASALAVSVADDTDTADVTARLRRLLADRPGLDVASSPGATGAAAAPGDANFQVLILLIVFGYIAIAVANSLIITTLARRAEFVLLATVGATPRQRRRVPRWEAVFLAALACVVGTLAALPGLAGLAYTLSNGERVLPSIDVAVYAVVAAVTFTLVLGAVALPARAAMRNGPRAGR